MLRFIISLWASKLCLFLFKHTGRERDDRPGILALRLCPDFLDRVKKPQLVVAVTGTNGKTTISNLVSNILNLEGKRLRIIHGELTIRQDKQGACSML